MNTTTYRFRGQALFQRLVLWIVLGGSMAALLLWPDLNSESGVFGRLAQRIALPSVLIAIWAIVYEVAPWLRGPVEVTDSGMKNTIRWRKWMRDIEWRDVESLAATEHQLRVRVRQKGVSVVPLSVITDPEELVADATDRWSNQSGSHESGEGQARLR